MVKGGKCWAEVVIDLDRNTKLIDYPKALIPYDFLIVLSEESARGVKKTHLKEGENTGYLIWDSSTIKKFNSAKRMKSLALPVQRLALEKFGNTVYGNSILFGAFTSLSKIISEEAAIETIKNFVPKTTLEENLEAFELGKIEAQYFLKQLEEEKK
ncbi:MAG: 2-oxoacid:acceptor oxidoreductase family protein [Promethearchaeota archaeon]